MSGNTLKRATIAAAELARERLRILIRGQPIGVMFDTWTRVGGLDAYLRCTKFNSSCQDDIELLGPNFHVGSEDYTHVRRDGRKLAGLNN